MLMELINALLLLLSSLLTINFQLNIYASLKLVGRMTRTHTKKISSGYIQL